jgi:chromosome segregation protein
VKAGFETTVGRSLGSSLDYLIIKDHNEILRFPSIEAGGPGYIPQKPHVGERALITVPSADGVIAPLSDLLDAHAGYEEVVEALSRDMLVVEDINCAVVLWNQGMRSCSLVTRDGTIIEPSGVVRTTADMEKYAEGLKARAEKEEISGHLVSIGTQISDSRSRISILKQDFQGLKEALEAAQGRDRAMRKEVDALLEKRHGDAREMERLDERERSFVRDIEMWEGMLARIDEDLAAIISEKRLLDEGILRMQDEIRELETGRTAARQTLDQVLDAIGSHTAKKAEIDVKVALKRQSLQGISEQVEILTREIGRDASKIEELQNTKDAVVWALEKARADLEGAGEDAVRLESVMNSLAPELEDLTDRFNSMILERDECRDRISALEKEKNEISLKDREQEIALAMSMERYRSRFAREDLPDIPEGFDIEGARDRASGLEARIEKMGQINFASLEAYEQVQARWDDLHRQYEDVVQASTRLREVIENIEIQSIKAFMGTFEQIRTNFQELFSTMFGGGKADIVLAEGNPMDAGVEILACPPFKKLKSMSLLSEGEKTLCALSFIFALFKVRPSPFCILDEVDAPLDDANVIRFNRLIHSFSTDSQFIMVTHNRHTMEMADILYGVTFDVPGVSKVVSMVLQDA